MAKVKKWFKTNIELPLKANGIFISLETVRVNNSLKKPGSVFLEMARTAYSSGADYFYRVNDDTEMKDTWPALFVHSLQSLGKPFGAVGPKCNQGNQKILTHDFTSRLHMEIFEMNYYPPQLVDWWMDDWISYVYGKRRTFKAQNVHVIHHTGAHGQRYEVDQSNEALLVNLIQQGKGKIRKWMLQQGPQLISEDILREFDSDVFEANYDHTDIPVILEPSTGLILSSSKPQPDAITSATATTSKITGSTQVSTPDVSSSESSSSASTTSVTTALLDSLLDASVQEDSAGLSQSQGRGGRGVRRQRANRKGKKGNKLRLQEE